MIDPLPCDGVCAAGAVPSALSTSFSKLTAFSIFSMAEETPVLDSASTMLLIEVELGLLREMDATLPMTGDALTGGSAPLPPSDIVANTFALPEAVSAGDPISYSWVW